MHIFLFDTHNKQLLLMTLFDTFTGIGASFRTHSRNQNPESTDGQIDVEVEIVI